MGKYFEHILNHQYSLRPMLETIQGLQELLDHDLADIDRILILNLLAKLTFKRVSHTENYSYRMKALEIAQKNNMKDNELVIMNNWVFAMISVGDYENAYLQIQDLDTVVSNLPDGVQENPRIYEAIGRYLTHKAKLLFEKARTGNPDDSQSLIEEANEFYEEAIKRDWLIDHRRVNERIEWASELNKLLESGLIESSIPMAVLDEAHADLNSHECDHCRAYFYFTRAEFKQIEGNINFPISRIMALNSWESAVTDCEKSIEYYGRVEHTLVEEPTHLIEELNRRVSMETRPRKVFLSHRGLDKDLVRNFKETLETLGFEPWIDEDAMHAGEELERSLLAGFKESCGAVFFITSHFKDEGFLATEVNYAIQEKRKKGKQFAIVSLVFEGASDAAVPELLRPYVWKHPANQLEALRDIVIALPLQPSTPVWRN